MGHRRSNTLKENPEGKPKKKTHFLLLITMLTSYSIKKITNLPFKPTKNKFAALAAHDEIVNFSGTLNTTANPHFGQGEMRIDDNNNIWIYVD